MGYLFQKRLYASCLFFPSGSKCSSDALFFTEITRADRGNMLLAATARLQRLGEGRHSFLLCRSPCNGTSRALQNLEIPQRCLGMAGRLC